MDLSIIIVNWNSKDHLRKCLDSILAETSGIEFEIIVIDSASFDGCGEMLREQFPQVKFVQSDENLGFAKANNTAFSASTGDFLLFLNPDTELQGAAINKLYAALQTLPDAGVLGARLLNTDGTIQNTCVRAFPTILNQLLETDALRERFPRSRLWGMEALFAAGEDPKPVEAISGACLMMRRSVFERIGLFSTDYFMYSEDMDLCFKTRSAGLQNYYVPSAVIVHHGGASSTQSEASSFSSVMMLESRWRYFLKTRSWCYGCLYRVGMFGISASRLVIVLPALAAGRLVTNGTALRKAYQKWLARLRWTVGLEDWVRNYRG